MLSGFFATTTLKGTHTKDHIASVIRMIDYQLVVLNCCSSYMCSVFLQKYNSRRACRQRMYFTMCILESCSFVGVLNTGIATLPGLT